MYFLINLFDLIHQITVTIKEATMCLIFQCRILCYRLARTPNETIVACGFRLPRHSFH